MENLGQTNLVKNPLNRRLNFQLRKSWGIQRICFHQNDEYISRIGWRIPMRTSLGKVVFLANIFMATILPYETSIFLGSSLFLCSTIYCQQKIREKNHIEQEIQTLSKSLRSLQKKHQEVQHRMNLLATDISQLEIEVDELSLFDDM